MIRRLLLCLLGLPRDVLVFQVPDTAAARLAWVYKGRTPLDRWERLIAVAAVQKGER